jgi:hypothetical protein
MHPKKRRDLLCIGQLDHVRTGGAGYPGQIPGLRSAETVPPNSRRLGKGQSSRRSRGVTKSGDKPRAAPKLNHLIIEKLRGLFDGFAVVPASEAPEVSEMSIGFDEIRPVICHP